MIYIYLQVIVEPNFSCYFKYDKLYNTIFQLESYLEPLIRFVGQTKNLF